MRSFSLPHIPVFGLKPRARCGLSAVRGEEVYSADNSALQPSQKVVYIKAEQQDSPDLFASALPGLPTAVSNPLKALSNDLSVVCFFFLSLILY
ncbi:hypothetical protein SRHO_G00325790 [Serrasalmus rhombeus]